MRNIINKPKLLSPAGSFDALCAAVSAGADEVYFGAGAFNARYGAKNFSDDELKEAISLCRICGVKTNITVNTVLFDKEINDALDLVYRTAVYGADAFIVQDMGLASEIKKQMPSLELHASTQCACHNKDGADRLYESGFSRIVLARELSREDIGAISSDPRYETEIFVHGALCVSHSGQCLFSHAVGGRSGNRGMCAQPCRMEYFREGSGKSYALSLRDLSLSKNITELLGLGIASLKIEGRMKSPEYVYGVTSVFKTLITEERNATDDETEYLSSLFSRSGFTDGYFTKSYLRSNKSMYGVRSEREKQLTKKTEENIIIKKPSREISAVCSFRCGEPPKLSFICGEHVSHAEGQNIIEKAKNSAADFDSVAKNITKLGDTYFSLSRDNISMSLDSDAFVPAGVINELRRKAAAELESTICAQIPVIRSKVGFIPPRAEEKEREVKLRLYFESTENFDKKIRNYKNIDSIVFDPKAFVACKKMAEICQKYKTGVLFPRVMFENEKQRAAEFLAKAKMMGACFCEVSNIGHIDIVKNTGLEVYGGIGLNITNTLSAEYHIQKSGMASLVLSPEMKFGAIRDIPKLENVSYCYYARGRLPLMTLESCIVRATSKCNMKDGICSALCDRTGAKFPIYPQARFDTGYPCRNIIYNSVIHDHRMKKELYRCGIDILCISAEENGLPM